MFLGSDIFRGSVYGKGHPLNIARVWPVIDICQALDWIEREYHSIPPAQPEALQLFHTADYIQALQEAEKYQKLATRKCSVTELDWIIILYFRKSIAVRQPPQRPAFLGLTYCCQAICQTVFNPSGGTHHGMPDRANGFCFVNDPALAILTLLEGGAGRVAYIDIDAHHADGVEAHLSSDPRVKLWSVHEENRWPRTGLAGDKGGGQARNFPLARGAENTALLEILNQQILPDIRQFSPEFIVLQAGCDGLIDDPQSGLAYTNKAIGRR